MKLIVLLGATVALTACDIRTKDPTEGDNGVTMAATANGQVSFDFPFARGQVKLPAGMMENSNFDLDGVKMIPGGQVTGFNVDANNGPTEIRMTFTAPVSPADARSYFVEQFADQGVQAALAGQVVTGESKDGTPFVISFAPAGSGTNGTIVLKPKS